MSQQEFPVEVVEAVARAICREYGIGTNGEYRPWKTRQLHAIAALRTLAALGYRRVQPGEVVVPRTTYVAVLASLSAAVSLLERGGKQGAPSNKMFGMMLEDYRRDLAEGRAMLAAAPARGDV
jgi:hypothetical protein